MVLAFSVLTLISTCIFLVCFSQSFFVSLALSFSSLHIKWWTNVNLRLERFFLKLFFQPENISTAIVLVLWQAKKSMQQIYDAHLDSLFICILDTKLTNSLVHTFVSKLNSLYRIHGRWDPNKLWIYALWTFIMAVMI